MNPTFQDHFSARASAYARFRPHYPAALFDWLARVAPAHRLALDCATGNGQAAVPLARHFARVVAIDASAGQLRHAQPDPGVTYREALAHDCGLADHSADLVTVAQALHWLDAAAFFAEARRVLAPRGVVAVWCYGLMRTGAGIDAAMDHYYHEVVGAYWPPERRHAEDGYRSIVIPFEPLDTPAFEMTAAMSLDAMAGYVGTWSATERYRAARGHDPVTGLIAALRPHWGPPDAVREIRWPLAVRAGRV